MTLINRSEIKARIEAEIRKTQALVDEYKELTQPISPENAIGRVSRMDAIQNKSVMEAALRKNQEKLQKLNDALRQVDDEHFGICVHCKQAIPLGRILLMPQSRSCVNCSR